jgi:probable HAF family extracellular repeat protein
MQDLGILPGGKYSEGTGVSGNGSIIVGAGSVPPSDYLHAVRWSGGVATDLHMMDGLGSGATGVSLDGSVIVGGSGSRAFRWTADDGMRDLAMLEGGLWASAYDVSGDGSIAVGETYLVTNQWRATLWSGGTVLNLGTLPTGGESTADGISENGRVVVGRSGSRAFRWTAETGMRDLGRVASSVGNYASATNADGSVIVGFYESTFAPNRALIWTADRGMRDLATVLADGGAHLDGWVLSAARDVSADGRTLIGFGINPQGETEAWVAVIPAPGATILVAGVTFAVVRRRR